MREQLAVILVCLALAGCAAPGGPATSSSPSLIASSTPAPSPLPSVGLATAEPSLPPCLGPDSVGCLARAVSTTGAEGRFVGVVLVAKDGKPLWQGAYSEGGRIQLDTPQYIASASKMFTGTAVAQLVDEGVLRFEDRVGTVVPDLPPDVARATISQLLSHTSGLALDGWGSGLPFKPGTFHYSNAGFNLLAQVVEQKADRVFADYLEERVFKPAGMEATGFDRPQIRGAPVGAGSELSTAGDLLRFANALFSYRLLDEATTTTITTKKVDNEWGGYGYGFALFAGEAGEIPSVGHIGSMPPLESAVEINPKLGYTIVILSEDGFDEIEPDLKSFQKAIGMGYWRG
jgi:CubicO group peptidase (beta-lactamase class C family)